MATAQLQLLQSEESWKLDRRTIEVGLAGVAQARAALAGARRHRVTTPGADSRSATQDELDLVPAHRTAA